MPSYLFCNKADLLQDGKEQGYDLSTFITEKELQRFAEEQSFAGALFTSAKTGESVSQAFQLLFQEVLRCGLPQGKKMGGVQLGEGPPKKKSTCC